MFLNINGTIAKRLRKVGDKHYKVANNALYPQHERSEVIYELENLRRYKIRAKFTFVDGTSMWGYIRHVETDGQLWPRLFSYQNSTTGKTIAFPIQEVRTRHRVVYRREGP